MKLFKDMLGNHKHGKHSFSQGRVYLFTSVVAYFAILVFLVIRAGNCDLSVETGPLEIIISALQWAIALFAGYVFGGKGLEVLRILMGKKKSEEKKVEPKKEEKKNGKQLLNASDPEDGPVI